MHESHDQDENVFTEAYWDDRYAASARIWSGHPNQRLVEHAADLAPGQALDVGCGEGADVVWLAERGWRVTGADVSSVALEKARAHAGEAGVADRTSWLHLDLRGDDPLPGGADLVTAMYIHVPEDDFDRIYLRIAAAVRPGGTLLVAGHHPDERHTDLRNPQLSHLLFAPERITRLLEHGWLVEVAEARQRAAHPGHEHANDRSHDHSHGAEMATDTVVVAHRDA